MKGDTDLMNEYRKQHQLAMQAFTKVGGLLQQDGYRNGRRAIALKKLMFKFNVDIPKDPIVNIQTTENRGFTPDEVAERCVEKLISVSDTTHPAIRDQAQAFKKHMEKVVAFYMRLFAVTAQPCIMP